jgi:ribokinase
VAVAVVGSLNLDHVVRVTHHPAGGETVLGGDLLTNPGGKGANQAVAAARLGQPVAMVGAVGDDAAGQALLGSLAADAVDTAHVRVVEGVPSGVALITVDGGGENAIVVSPGANGRLSDDDVRAAAGALRSAAVTLVQLEVPLEAVAAAAATAGGAVVLNPAPATDLPQEVLEAVTVLVPNRGELARLAGADQPPASHDEVVELVGRVRGPRGVVVTLGADGALIVAGGRSVHVPAVKVPVVDTTAAGDSFCGALADGLCRGMTVEQATRWAVRAAAVTVTRPGAQAAMPRRAEVVATPA